MYLTEKEINEEFKSIDRCVKLVLEQRNEVKKAFESSSRYWFIGSGSGYCLAKSSASLMLLRCGKDSYAAAAGDIMLNFKKYEQAFENSTVVFLSRSGSTSEVIEVAKLITGKTNACCVSVCAKSESALDEFCQLNIHIPWAFDESICQTKTVGSLYSCVASIVSIISGDESITNELLGLVDNEASYRQSLMSVVDKVARTDWDHVVVLSDAETAGIMEEGSLAFKEICQVNSNFYNILDVRHGPMVMIDSSTFVCLLLDEPGQIVNDLVADIKAKGTVCVVCGPHDYNSCADASIIIPCKDSVVTSLYALYFLQLVSLHKALQININPDEPDGLSAWVKIS